MPESRGDRRRREILEVAGQMFLEEGYAATSMSAIAARLGGSKATLYSYYLSKEALFAAFIQDVCTKFVGTMFGFTYTSDTLTNTLKGIGQRYINLALSDRAKRIYRLVSAETERFPELGRMFYEAGPRIGHEKLSAILQYYIDSGQLQAIDADIAAKQFLGLFLPIVDDVRIFHIPSAQRQDYTERYISEAVNIFLHGIAIKNEQKV